MMGTSPHVMTPLTAVTAELAALDARGQTPAAGSAGAGFGAPADAPPPRPVAPGPYAVTRRVVPDAGHAHRVSSRPR